MSPTSVLPINRASHVLRHEWKWCPQLRSRVKQERRGTRRRFVFQLDACPILLTLCVCVSPSPWVTRRKEIQCLLYLSATPLMGSDFRSFSLSISIRRLRVEMGRCPHPPEYLTRRWGCWDEHFLPYSTGRMCSVPCIMLPTEKGWMDVLFMLYIRSRWCNVTPFRGGGPGLHTIRYDHRVLLLQPPHR